MNKERLVFEIVDGVKTLEGVTLGRGELRSPDFTPEGGRELVSRATRIMSLSPDYSIHHAFDFE